VAIDEVGNESPPATVAVERRSASEEGVPLEGLSLWVSADQGVTEDASGFAERWADRSDNANDLVQTTATKRPAPALGDGGWPVLRFDGADDTLSFTTRLTDVQTVFWVVSESEDAAGASAERSLLGDYSSAYFRGGNGDPGAIWGAGASNQVKQGQTWVNGKIVDGTREPRPRAMSVVSVVTSGNTSADRFGEAYYSAPWWGDLAELIVYRRALSAGEREAVEDYLVRKYHPYPPSASTPAISPAGGVFTGSTTVQLSTTTPQAEIHYTLDGSEPTLTSDLYTAALVIDETTTIKARAFDPDGVYLDSATATATFVRADQSPVVATSPVLWLRADAGIATNGGGGVTDWLDQSGHGNDASQSNGVKVPELVPDALNHLPVVRFDGGDTVQFTNRLTSVRTVFWVVSESPDAAGASTERSLLGDYNSVYFRGGSGDPGAIWGGGASSQVKQGQTRVNGVPVDGTATPRPRQMSVVSLVTTGNATADRFGEAYYSVPWWGDLAELIVYDRALDPGERKAVEDYLLAKYATTGQVTTPVVSPPGGVFSGSVDVMVSTGTPGAEIRYTLDGTEPTLSSDVYVSPIPIGRTTTLKAKAFRADLVESATATAGFTQDADATPLRPGLVLWWRADAGVPGEAGDYWEDQSGQGNHGYQPSGAKAPRLFPNAVNGLPVMRFDGVDDTVQLTNRLTSVRTVFWVVSESPDAAGASTERSLLGDYNSVYFRGGNGDPGAIWGAGASSQVKQGQTRVNGVPVDGTATARPRQMSVVSLVTTGNATADRFGEAYYSVPWWGDLAELIVYERALDAGEVSAVEKYLNGKYHLFVELP
jgi:hypothetical protein